MVTKSDNDAQAPAHAEQDVSTAPSPSVAEEIVALRREVEQLRARLGEAVPVIAEAGLWPRRITYADQIWSGSRLSGITKQRERVRPSSDFPELPQPSRDMEQLEADFVRWGYCLVADAMSPSQVSAQVNRLMDQASAERAAGVARMSHHGHAQTVFNLLPKGQVFRDLAALEPAAADAGPLVEELLAKMLGPAFYLATAHGSIVHERGGLQELHQDQGIVPLPHPPFPLFCLIIWLYTDFGLEEGGTYVVPGSHRDAAGNNLVRPDTDFAALADERLVALNAPAGTCFLTDSRLLHSGGKRTAPGTRLASRILYCRPEMRQQENQLAGMSEETFRALSPKLKQLIGFRTFQGWGMVDGNVIDPDMAHVPVGELSMSRPEAFDQDFDSRHSEDARRRAAADWETFTEYRGPR